MIHIFIVNTKVAKTSFGDNLRAHLAKRNDIRYFVVNTSRANDEVDAVARFIQLFEGERMRFYACGGSGTMREIMHGTGDYKHVEFAFCPCGQTNDFLKVFGSDIEAFKDIDNLIDGHVERIDYIKTNHGVALNTISYGIDTTLSSTLETVQEYDIFGPLFPFLLSYIKSIVEAKPTLMKIQIDDKVIEDGVTELIVGNGSVLGGMLHFSEHSDCRDGIFEYLIINNCRGLSAVKMLQQMVKNDMENVKKKSLCGKGTRFVVESFDGSDITMNLDGEIVKGSKKWEIEIIKQGMNFVMPKGVKVL